MVALTFFFRKSAPPNGSANISVSILYHFFVQNAILFSIPTGILSVLHSFPFVFLYKKQSRLYRIAADNTMDHDRVICPSSKGILGAALNNALVGKEYRAKTCCGPGGICV